MKAHAQSSFVGRKAQTQAVGGRTRSALCVRAASDKYDYIIVGGGTAGCVLANRLTAKDKKVLVLEAGPSGDSWEIALPAALTRLFKHPVLDWGLMSVNQKELKRREVYLARGKTLGGSSCTNATLYQRGSAHDYDSWGLPGWDSKDLLKCFVDAEDFADGPTPYHGKGGTMCVERPRYENPMFDAFFKACAEVGLKPNPDFNDWSRPQAGYGEFWVTQKKGERADMYRMHLKPALARGNLKVITRARTTKLHFEESSSGGVPRAVGVEYCLTDHNNPYGPRTTAELAPGGEVLLCAGAVHSPHLLQLSGLGPATMLHEHGVPLVADLPGVGANLQDHPATLYAARTHEQFDGLSVTSQIYDKRSNIKPGAVLNYLINRKGPLATTGCDRGAFVSTKGAGEPDLQIRFVAGCALDPDAIQSYIVFADLKRRGLAWPCGITMQLLAVRPKSKGTVGLRSADPFSNPAIDLGYFTGEGEEDVATLREGLKLSRRLTESSPLSQYLSEERFPGPRATTDADLDDFIRSSACSGNALVGTCRMGDAADKSSVVSAADFTVHGVSGLRVVDASVIPRIPGGQTGAATVMIAERAAALLAGGQPIISGGSKGSNNKERELVGAA